MKFTKENLAETLQKELVKKVEKLSISDKTLQAQVEALYAFAGEDDELDAFAQKVLPSLVSLDGNYRKDNADFVKKWESEHPSPNPDPKPKEKPNEPDGLEEIRKQLQELRAARDEEVKNRTISQKRNELLEKLKKENVSSKWAESYASKIPLSAETDIEREVKDALSLFNGTEASIEPSVTPQHTGTPQRKEDNADVLAILKQRRGEN